MLWYFCQACDEYLPLAGKPARTNNTRAQTGSGGKFGQCHHRWVVQYPGHPTLVSGHTGHCQEPHNEPGLTIATFFPATRWLWRERRGGGGSGAARAQQVSTRAGAAAAAARASQVSWKNEEKQYWLKNMCPEGSRGSRRSSTTNLVASLREPDNDLPRVSQLE